MSWRTEKKDVRAFLISLNYSSGFDFANLLCSHPLLYVSIAFNVIRVEPTEVQNRRNADTNVDNTNPDDMDVEYYCTSGEVTGENDVGRGVARVMLGKSTFRGAIQKVLSFNSVWLYNFSSQP